MIESISHSEPKANKNHKCECSEFVIDHLIPEIKLGMKIPFEYLRKIVTARKDGFKILKGQNYIKQVNKFDGEIYTWRARKDMYEVCDKYDLFPEL